MQRRKLQPNNDRVKKINRNRQEMVDDRMVKIVITNNMSDVQNKTQTNKKKKRKAGVWKERHGRY